MENYHAFGIIRQNTIDGTPGRRMTQFGNGGRAFIGHRNGNKQPALAGHWHTKEEIIYGPTQTCISD